MADALAQCDVRLGGGDEVVVEDRVVARDVPMAEVIRAGTCVGPVDATVVVPPSGPAVMVVVVVGGEASGAVFRLPVGRYLVGSADGLILQLEAQGVEPHAAVLHVMGEPGRPQVRVTHVAGAPPMVGEAPVGDLTRWDCADPLTLGGARLEWQALSTDTPPSTPPLRVCDPDAPWWWVCQRRGRPASTRVSPASSRLEVSTGSGPALAPAAVMAATSATMAVVLRQPLLALMATSTVVATAAWWLAVRWRRRRRHQRQAGSRRETVARMSAEARRTRRPVHHAMDVATGRHEGLWERRPQRHHDVWQVVVGRGRERCDGDGWCHDVPVVVDMAPGACVGFSGSGAVALARAAMAQLITQVGPSDVSLSVVAQPHDRRLADLAVVPHLRSRAEHRVVVVLMTSTGQMPAHSVDDAVALLVVDERRDGEGVEAWCTTVIHWDVGVRSADLRQDGELQAEVVPAGVTAAWFHELVRAVVGWHDPDAAMLPVADGIAERAGVAWAELHRGPLTAEAAAGRWDAARLTGASGIPALVGRSGEGSVTLDLVRHGPHMLIAGTTGSGKSELLRTVVCSWAWHTPPDRLHLVLIDYKGGAAFDACGRLPHVVDVVTDLDGDMSTRVITGLRSELTRRERVLRDAGVSDLSQWGEGGVGEGCPPRLVIVVDEVAALVHERPEVVTALVAMAQRGRSLGVHLVLATQRPAGVVRDDVRANTELRICLRVADRAEALDVVGDVRPAGFDRRQPGRALVRSGADEPLEVQVADTSGPWVEDTPPVQVLGYRPAAPSVTATPCSTLHRVVDLLSSTAHLYGYHPPGRLWQPPLPRMLTDDGDVTVIGVLDDVEHRRRLPLISDPSGHALVIGAPRSGVTHTLGRIIASRREHDVVHLTDATPIAPVVETLLALVDERRRGRSPGRPRSVVIDGVGAWRRRWEQELGSASWTAAGQWDRLLSDGPSVGVVVVAGADRVVSCGATLMSVATTRWLLRPLDPLDPAHVGVRWPSGAPDDHPPGRLVDAATGLVGQVAFSTPSTM